MPNGYLGCRESVLKTSEAPFSCLREQGHSSVIHVDDSLLAGDTYKDCLDNIHETNLLEGLGFHIHPKNCFYPTK